MAWQEVTTDVVKIGRVKYSVAFKHGGARVTVPQEIVDRLKWSGATKFKLFVGAGELDGKLRIVASDIGTIGGRPPPHGRDAKPAPKGAARKPPPLQETGGLIIRLGRWPGLAERDVEKIAVDVTVEVEASALTITLPVHAQMKAPAPRTQTTAAPPVAAATPGVKVDVTSKFFNDPPASKVGMVSGTRGGR